MTNMKKLVLKCLLMVIRYVKVLNEFFLTSLFAFIHGKPKLLPPITDETLLKPATVLAEEIRNGKLKSVDLVERYIRRMRDVQPVINAVVEDRYEEAIAEAEAADQLVASGTVTPEQLAKDKPFLGVPLTTKNCYAVKGMLQDAGLVLRKGFRAPQDADCMALLRKAGAIPLAVTNISELCMWWESYNKLHGRTNNPYDSRRICGGSSGGEGKSHCQCWLRIRCWDRHRRKHTDAGILQWHLWPQANKRSGVKQGAVSTGT
uniref:Putative amidase n=1 Tax=Rhipicephalus microplus TaxID=6941 RepID=A0A6G5A1Q1_RHIMP